MKIIIYKWKSDNKYYTDVFTEKEALNCESHIGERFEFNLNESEIEIRIKELISDKSEFKKLIAFSEGLQECLFDVAYDYANGNVHKGEILKLLNESVRKEVVNEMVDELRQRVPTGNKR